MNCITNNDLEYLVEELYLSNKKKDNILSSYYFTCIYGYVILDDMDRNVYKGMEYDKKDC